MLKTKRVYLEKKKKHFEIQVKWEKGHKWDYCLIQPIN